MLLVLPTTIVADCSYRLLLLLLAAIGLVTIVLVDSIN